MILAQMPNWFMALFPAQSMPLTLLILCAAVASGLSLGTLKFKGISLGIPAVMFTSILLSHLLGTANLTPAILAFIRDFGLILFVYAVGVQVGPGFLASLRRNGLPLNLLATAIVLAGAGLSVMLARATGTPIPAVAGLFAGATTNAPALASASEALKTTAQSVDPALPAFAIAYPFGLVGVILAMLILKLAFRVRPELEAERLRSAGDAPPPTTLNIELKNPNLAGLQLSRICELAHRDVVISRVLHAGSLAVASPEMPVALGDVLLAVGPKEQLQDLRLILGAESPMDLVKMPSNISAKPMIVTHREAIGQTVDALDLPGRLGVTITRITRAGLQFVAVGGMRLQFGDQVLAVGDEAGLGRAATLLGNSTRELDHPRLTPIFVGIFLGVILGSIPVYVPHLPAPLKLGLATGPMLVALFLSRAGNFGPLIYYMPPPASQLLREMGITLFLAAVGLQAGDPFFDTLRSPLALKYLSLGAAVTLLPLVLIGVVSLFRPFKLNYLHTCGLLAGSMTSPSLAFTQTMTPSEAPALSFATVYPLTMLLRVITAQLIVLLFR